MQMRSTTIVSALLCLASLPAWSQSNGSISGTIKDPNGAVVQGAQVAVASQALGIRQSTTSDSAGDFLFAQLPPGTYQLTVEVFRLQEEREQQCRAARILQDQRGRHRPGRRQLDRNDHCGSQRGHLQIQSESGERSNTLTNRQLRDIGLNGRNVVDLMRTIPGVIAGGVTANAASTVTNITGGFSINGTRSAQHEYTMDGVTNLNLGNNTGALVSINPDALEEVKVLTSNYQAEYGRAGGGFIALSTRGGTNEFHGGGAVLPPA